MGQRNYKINFDNGTEFSTLQGCINDAIALAIEMTGFSTESITEIKEDNNGEISNLRGAALDIWLYGPPSDWSD